MGLILTTNFGFYRPKMKAFLLSTLILFSLGSAYAIRCYKGDGDYNHEEVDCPSNNFKCIKQTAEVAGFKTSTYGSTASNQTDGCSLELIGLTEKCFCSTDLCNDQTMNTSSLIVLTFMSIFTILFSM